MCKKLFFSLGVLGLLALPNNSFSQTGPGGVGTNTGTSNLALWLQADLGVTSSSGNVSQWNDQSGNGINVTQGTPANQPNVISTVLNGFPVIRFTKANSDRLASTSFTTINRRNHTLIFVMSYNKAASDNDAGVIATSGTSVAGTIILKKNGNAFEYQGTAASKVTLKDPANFASHKVYVLQRDSTASAVSTWRNGENTINASAIGANVAYQFSLFKFGVNRQGTKYSSMDIAEAIVYYRKINSAERIIIRNYLSAKYGLILNVGDKYAGDSSVNGHYDYNVIGIGKASDGSQTESKAAGLILEQVSGFDNGDYLMAGHKVTSNSQNGSDITGIGGSKPARWDRVWFVDKTDASTAMSVNLTFDFSEGGFSSTTPTSSSNYKLLYRSGQSGNWTVVSTASSINGDQVIFSSQALSNGDGYYTIGTLDSSASPLPVELISFNGKVLNGLAHLNWATASEQNSNFFEIQRSADNKHWQPIGMVNAIGNSTNIIKYTYKDNEPLQSTKYYRLKQVDFDGVFTYTKTIMLADNANKNRPYSINANPNSGVFNLYGEVPHPELIKLYNSTGVKVKFSYRVLENGLLINAKNLKSGIYYLVIPTGVGIESKKIIINNHR